jgi:uncharacterized protein with gpF-like domain
MPTTKSTIDISSSPSTIVGAFRDVKEKPKRALKALSDRGRNMMPSGAWDELSASNHYNGFTVAQSQHGDVLHDLMEGLKEAKASGMSPDEFVKNMTPILEKKGWVGFKELTDPKTGNVKRVELGTPRRLKLILMMNRKMSYARGQHKMMMLRSADKPIFRYKQLDRPGKNPMHTKFNGMYFWYEDPIVQRIWPPSWFGCGCRFEQFSIEEALRITGKTDIQDVIQNGSRFMKEIEESGDFKVQPLKDFDPLEGKNYSPGLKRAMQKKANDILKEKQAALERIRNIKEKFLSLLIRLKAPLTSAQAKLSALNASTDTAAAQSLTIIKDARTLLSQATGIYQSLPSLIKQEPAAKDIERLIKQNMMLLIIAARKYVKESKK